MIDRRTKPMRLTYREAKLIERLRAVRRIDELNYEFLRNVVLVPRQGGLPPELERKEKRLWQRLGKAHRLAERSFRAAGGGAPK